MKQEELLKALIKELFAMDTLHQEYKDNDSHFVVDSTKEGNTLTIKVQLLENEDKKNFEDWLQQVDDNLFQEVLEELSEKDGLSDINSLYNSYNSKDYQQVIDKVKTKTKEIANRKIKMLKKLINSQ